MRSKPRIKFKHGQYQCVGRVCGGDLYGYGKTAREAYWNWIVDGFKRDGIVG